MKIIVGTAGMPGSGKDTLGDELVRLATADGISAAIKVFSRDILRPTIELINSALANKIAIRYLPYKTTDAILRLWGIATTEDNQEKLIRVLSEGFGPTTKELTTGREKGTQPLAQFMVKEEGFGENALAFAARARALADPSQLTMIVGVRWFADEKMLRELSQFTNGNAAGKIVYIHTDELIRFERQKSRGRDKEEAELTFEQFQRQDRAKNEVNVPEIGSRADWKIVNNGTREEYLREIERIYNKELKPLLIAA